jgi:hypothetical protein
VYVDIAALGSSGSGTDESGAPTIFFDVSSEHAKELLARAQADVDEGEAAANGSDIHISMCKRLPEGLESQVNQMPPAPPRERRYAGYGGPAQGSRGKSYYSQGRGAGGSGERSGYRSRGNAMGPTSGAARGDRPRYV